MSYFQRLKRSHRRALGLFLLVLPLGGIAFQLPGVQAQPTPTIPTPKKSFKPLPAEQKAAIDKVLAIARSENASQIHIDLKVENATLEDVTARVKALLPGQSVPIRVRDANPVRVSFDLKNERAGDVLNHVAALAGCRLFLLSEGLLIAPPSRLTEAESLDVKQRRGGEWAKNNVEWSNEGPSRKLFAMAIAQEVTGSDAKVQPATVVKTAFSNFSPDSQAMLQQMADWSRDTARTAAPDIPRLNLNPNSSVKVDTSTPNEIRISLSGGPSDSSTGSMTAVISIR